MKLSVEKLNFRTENKTNKKQVSGLTTIIIRTYLDTIN